MKKVFLFLSLAAITIISCKKEATKSCPTSMADLAGTYSFVKVESGGGGTYSDVTSYYTEACERDNKLTLNANGTYTYTDAGTVCTTDESSTGNWDIDITGHLNIGSVGPFNLDDLTIISFDCSTLVAEADFGTVGSTPIKVRFTFRK
ncbi:lipocalin family protein [Ferruginibacter lapsinanis]|uniref:lipocalin family protein n=1 Tax=Ferruginibacter lapsinanis TaxID=563172 RepID=UPI001E4B5EAB|nr:lipocalin family protein [Ferruginibacter lapsinanis]UEG49219.1 lipocalin family protein [Ferruginibacter lapsinanis]